MQERTSSDSTMRSQGRANHPPYMDVQTVKNNVTVDQAAVLDGQSHCLLLVEPVLVPDLGHTGVSRETQPGSRPFFYPNGVKNCRLGAKIRKVLYKGANLVTHGSGGGGGSSHHRAVHHKTSDWTGSSAYDCLSDESHSLLSGPIPAGQGGTTPADVWDAPPRRAVRKGKTGLANTAWASKRSICRTRVVQGGVAKEETAAGFGASSSSRPEALLDQRWEEDGGDRSLASNERRLRLQQSQRQGDRLLSKGNPPSVPFLERRDKEGDKTSRSRHPDFNADTTTETSSKDTIHTHMSMNSWSGEAPPGSHINGWTECETETDERDMATSTAIVEADATYRTTHISSIRSRDDDGAGFICVGDAGGRDSEWVAERRAANREAAEVLSALRRNSSRLWQLVGGGV